MLLSLALITLSAVGLTSAAWNEQCVLPAFAKTVSTAANLSPENALHAIKASASCQQCDVQADGSGYYVPGLFYQHPNGQVEEVTNNGLSIQYSAGSSAIPFPAGLTMVAGNPLARTSDPAGNTGLTCHEDPTFPHPFCPDALTGFVKFQSCWNGHDLVTADNSHVAYPADNACPSSHPVELPSIYLEVVYKVNVVPEDPRDGGYYFLADGDTTGYGFFGTFVSRWNPSVLAATIEQCGAVYPLEPTQSCAPLQASGIDTGSRTCPPHGPHTRNQVSSGFTTMTSTQVSPAPTTTSTTAPSSTLTFVPVIAGEAFIGCYTDDPTHHTLTFRYTDPIGMTEESCVGTCGAKYAGVLDGNDCYCGYELYEAAEKVDNSECNVPCPGAPSESCGGVNRMVVYESG